MDGGSIKEANDCSQWFLFLFCSKASNLEETTASRVIKHYDSDFFPQIKLNSFSGFQLSQVLPKAN